jgi:hypothetical protein
MDFEFLKNSIIEPWKQSEPKLSNSNFICSLTHESDEYHLKEKKIIIYKKTLKYICYFLWRKIEPHIPPLL